MLSTPAVSLPDSGAGAKPSLRANRVARAVRQFPAAAATVLRGAPSAHPILDGRGESRYAQYAQGCLPVCQRRESRHPPFVDTRIDRDPDDTPPPPMVSPNTRTAYPRSAASTRPRERFSSRPAAPWTSRPSPTTRSSSARPTSASLRGPRVRVMRRVTRPRASSAPCPMP
jgi:hypothetical protein